MKLIIEWTNYLIWLPNDKGGLGHTQRRIYGRAREGKVHPKIMQDAIEAFVHTDSQKLTPGAFVLYKQVELT